MACSIQGMECVVATVSGYHGTEKFNLIKLISQTGANYVGAMSKSITHLICWKFEGSKYNLAKKFKTIIVNHRWVEECINQGKRVPERPYMLKCGQETGPLLMEASVVAKKGDLVKKHKVSSEKSHILSDTEIETGDMVCGPSHAGVWINSSLLKENIFPDYGKSCNRSGKLKRKPVGSTSKLDNQSSERYGFRKPTLTELLIREEHEQPVREKKKIRNCDKSTSAAGPSSKVRRLVKKKKDHVDILDFVLDSDEEYNPSNSRRARNWQNMDAEPSEGQRYIRNADFGSATNETFEDVEEIEDWNYPQTLRRSNDGILNVDERTSQDVGTDVDNFEENFKKNHPIENVTKLPASQECACIICMTEFSSTRGVLPCGHRYCYSCIQSWANKLAKDRKILTCPLCKASFSSIIKVEDAATSDQKIYSQTIPCSSSAKDIFVITDQARPSFGSQSFPSGCTQCRSLEPEDLLMACHLCEIRRIHTYCLDPYLVPWTCSHCKDLQMLYHHAC